VDATNAIARTLRVVVELLVRHDYGGLERMTGGERLRASEMEAAIRDYGRTLVMPLAEDFLRADVIPVQESSPPAYSVRFRIYTEEEGLSDLELQATLVGDPDAETLSVELDNIIVA